jgi:hypothetical protein
MLAQSKKLTQHDQLITKEKVKSFLRRSTIAYKTAEVLYENSLYVPHLLRQRMVMRVLGWREQSCLKTRQSILTWTVPIPPWNGPEDLIGWLKPQGVHVMEGAHTFYIAPQETFRQVAPSIVAFYPEQCGFKILKTCRDPLAGGYVYKNGRSLKFLMRLIGQPQDQLIPANYMFSSGIGPRVYDLTCWESQGKKCTVFVVEHVTGSQPTERQYIDFMARLKYLNTKSRLRILIPRWEEDQDFAPFDCNGNLIYSNSRARAQYVDFQNFGLTSLANGHGSNNSTMPAVADFQANALFTSCETTAEKRWALVTGLLSEHSISVSGRIILDIGCRSGITLGRSLSAGAIWSVGWSDADLEQIETRLFSWGITRFSLAALTDQNYSFERDIPQNLRHRLSGAVVFYGVPISRSIEIDNLLRLPWKVLVLDFSDAEFKDADSLMRKLPTVQFEVIPHDKPPLIVLIRRD